QSPRRKRNPSGNSQAECAGRQDGRCGRAPSPPPGARRSKPSTANLTPSFDLYKRSVLYPACREERRRLERCAQLAEAYPVDASCYRRFTAPAKVNELPENASATNK